MLILTIHDKNGTELKFGDIVKIECHSSGAYYTFFSEVKYLPESQAIAPFHTFAFHGFEKVDQVPEGAVLMYEQRYKCWMLLHEDESYTSPSRQAYSRYLSEWRECEHLLSEKIFRIHLTEEAKYIKGQQLNLI